MSFTLLTEKDCPIKPGTEFKIVNKSGSTTVLGMQAKFVFPELNFQYHQCSLQYHYQFLNLYLASKTYLGTVTLKSMRWSTIPPPNNKLSTK